MAHASTRTPINRAFLLDEETARRLHAQLLEFGDTVRISAEIPTGTVSFSDLEEFFAFPNSSKRPIIGLTMQADRNDYSFRSSVRFAFPYGAAPITYEVEGESDTELVFSEKIKELLSRTYQWHSFVDVLWPQYLLFFAFAATLISFIYDHRHKFLPAGVFYIGDGIIRYNKRIAVSKFWLVIVLLSGFGMPILASQLGKAFGLG